MAQPKSIQTDSDLKVNATSFRRSLLAANLGPLTVKTYMECVNPFIGFVREKGMPQKLSSIKREHVEAFLLDVLEQWEPSTALVRYGGLRAWFKWAVEEGEIRISPMVNMRPPKVPVKPIPVLTEDELTRLFQTCTGRSFEARRDLAILRIMATCGLRRAEISGLRYAPDDPENNDIDLDSGQLRVQGKGGRVRILGLDPRTVLALDRYLRVRASHRSAHLGSLWLGRRGALGGDGIRQMLGRRVNRAGIEKHVTPHVFRHTWAHHWMADGGSETDLMRLAGWKSRQMLERYGASAADERALAASKRVGIGSRI